ncbi:MAG TPA: glycosyltransferase family 9 protein [Candidatus Saccharimonadales bacterium]|nr:glycosyltransferase family 9 protein [Candidatus Saccharimonadales bacterium]
MSQPTTAKSILLQQHISTIAIWRPLKFGDFLVTVPALKALRAAFPKATIDYIGLPLTERLAARYDAYIDNYVMFPGLPGLPEREWQPDAVIRFFTAMQHRQYDLLLQLQGNGSVVNHFIPLCGAKITAGFTSAGAPAPSEFFMTYPEGTHEITKQLQLLAFLGIPTPSDAMEFPVRPEDITTLHTLPEAQGLGTDYICIHPGGVSGGRWEPKYFAAVADTLSSEGYQIVLTGTEQEKSTITQVQQHMRSPAVDLTGKTEVGQLAALLQQSRLYIGNDTGPSHMAVALGTPSVTIFTTADPVRWAPLDATLHPIIPSSKATPQTVIRAAQQLLATRRTIHASNI